MIELRVDNGNQSLEIGIQDEYLFIRNSSLSSKNIQRSEVVLNKNEVKELIQFLTNRLNDLSD